MKVFVFTVISLFLANVAVGQTKSGSMTDQSGKTVGRYVERTSTNNTRQTYYGPNGTSTTINTPRTGSLSIRQTGKPAGKSNSYSGPTSRPPVNSPVKSNSYRK